MDFKKIKNKNNGELVTTTRIVPLDENEIDGKKRSPLDATFTKSETSETSPDTEPPKKEEPPKVSFFKLYRFATKFDILLIFLGICFAIVTGAVIPFQMRIFGKLTDDMVSYGFAVDNVKNLTEEQLDALNDELIDNVTSFGIKYAIIGAITLIGSYSAVCLFNFSSIRQIYLIRTLFFKKTITQNIGWFDVNNPSDFASRMAEDLYKLEIGIGEKVSIFVHHQVAFLGCYIMAFTMGWQLALVCMVSLPVTFMTMGTIMKIVTKYSRRELAEYAKAGSIAEEVLSGIRTVIAFGGQSKEIDRYSQRLVYAKDNNIKRSLFAGMAFGILWFVIYSSYALAFWYGVRLMFRDRGDENGTYTVETMTTVFFSIMTGNMNFGMSTALLENFGIAAGAAAKVFSVIDRVPEIDATSDEGEKLDRVNGSITFKDVHFEYPSRPGVKVLQGLSLTINRGETVALVGKSGCGKSTCIQLIQRLYDPKEGVVRLDGKNLKDLNVAWLRTQIGVVGQEPVLFSTTISENIRYGNQKATQEDIENAAKKANAHEFIMGLPKGYDTMVGERGAQMSGGQKQRIAIARALVRNPAILLLDEATSALDTNSERKVQRALDRASEGRTTVIVAHRLSTIRDADKIVVISEGQVVEQGNHDELMKLKGHYFNLVTAQVGLDESIEDDTVEDDLVSSDKKMGKLLTKQISKISSISSNSDDIVRRESQISENELVTDLDDFDRDADPPDVSMLTIVSYNKPEWLIILIACCGSIVMGTIMPLFSVIFGNILGGISGDDEEQVQKVTNRNALLFVCLGIIAGFSIFLQQYCFGIAGEKLTMRLRGLLFQAMLRQEMGWFDDPKQGTGTLCARLSSDASAVQGATGTRIGTILQSCSTIVFGVGLSMYYEWRLGLVALAFAPFILFAMYLERSTMKRQNAADKKDIEKSAKLAVEVVSNIRTVVSLGRERLFCDEYIALLLPSYLGAKRSVHIRGFVFGTGRSLIYFAYAACIVYGGHLIVNDDLDFTRVFKVSQALIMGTASIAQAFAFAPNFQKGVNAAVNIFHLLQRVPKIQNREGVQIEENWKCQGDVDYKAVTFRYPTRPDTLVLRKLDLAIRHGKTVALVGSSGCGKSTVIQLLERFYDPNSGSIALDGRSLQNDLSMETLRAQLGLVSQEPVLFDRTIEENIAYGDNSREVTKSEIIEAAKRANIHNFITSLPLGYETRLGDKGTQLSGGQKQRVAIARALVRNPKILLLDEATSALDMESEQIVQDALDKARAGRTCITIAHRLTTIHDADTIFVINKGKVVEIGTHQELLSEKGIYYKLYQLQSKKLD